VCRTCAAAYLTLYRTAAYVNSKTNGEWLKAAFGLTDSPAVIALSPKKGRFAAFTGKIEKKVRLRRRTRLC
jgi:hypothetical protein